MNERTRRSRRAVLQGGILLGASTWAGTTLTACSSPDEWLDHINTDHHTDPETNRRRHRVINRGPDAAGLLLPGRGELLHGGRTDLRSATPRFLPA